MTTKEEVAKAYLIRELKKSCTLASVREEASEYLEEDDLYSEVMKTCPWLTPNNSWSALDLMENNDPIYYGEYMGNVANNLRDLGYLTSGEDYYLTHCEVEWAITRCVYQILEEEEEESLAGLTEVELERLLESVDMTLVIDELAYQKN